MEYESESRTQSENDIILKRLRTAIMESEDYLESGEVELDNPQDYIDAMKLMKELIENEGDERSRSLLAKTAKKAFGIIIPGKRRNEF